MRTLGVEELHTSNPEAGTSELGRLCIQGHARLGLDEKIISQKQREQNSRRNKTEIGKKREGWEEGMTHLMVAVLG